MNFELPIHELRGAIHLHSRFSDGSADAGAIVEAARAAGLDFVVLTDHDSIEARAEGFEGWHDGVLMIVGSEISPPGGAHFLALGSETIPDWKAGGDHESLMQQVIDAGGCVYVAHPAGRCCRSRPTRRDELPLWRWWDSPRYVGLEVWSYMHDCLRGLRPWNVRDFLRRPNDFVRGPDPRVLRRWDQIAMRRRLVGIGALDNHARHIPLIGWTFLPHRFAFESFQTHVFAPRMNPGGALRRTAVLASIAAGRSFAAFDALADSAGTRLFVAGDGRQWGMGEEFAFTPGLTLSASVPRAATLRVIRDGQRWHEREADSLEFPIEKPGVYRLEAYLDGRPWIFTNPVFVRGA